MKRRGVILTAAAVVLGWPALRYARQVIEPLPPLEMLDNPAGFRRLAGGAVSNGVNPFVGLEPAPTPPIDTTTVRNGLCLALYGDTDLTSDIVPIASFSDYHCPYCRLQTRDLAALAADQPQNVRICWHEWPLLGAASVLAARAAIAADRQGAYAAFHARLMSTPLQTTPAYLVALSDDLGLDHHRLVRDMQSEATQRDIDRSTALARVFGFVGTPAMIVGRTVVQGRISGSLLQRLIERERSDNWAMAC